MMSKHNKEKYLIAFLLLACLAASFIPLQPALAWTDRPAATTEDPAHAWTVVFENPMDTSTINSRNIYASTDQNGSSRVEGVAVSAADGTHAVVSPPPGGWSIGTTYYLIVTQNVLTSEGMPLEDAVRMQFTVQTTGQTAPVLPDSGIKVYLEDQPLVFTVPPQTIDGRVMVPMRPIFEAMGATLDWDSATQTATAVKGATTVITKIGSNIAIVNGVEQTLDVPPTAINGSTLAPLRFVAEAFGYHVKWDGTSQTAYISAVPFSEPTSFENVYQGGTVYFGSYEQDNDLVNGPEPIAWKVLAVEGNKVLLLSDKGVDCKKYNEIRTDVTWESCTLRAWLNQEFLQEAFSSEERTKIAVSTLSNPDNPKYGTDGGIDTSDQIFVLSLDEVQRYFANDKARCMQPTPHAIACGAISVSYPELNGNGNWWLRSPGEFSGRALAIGYAGTFDIGGCGMEYDGWAVRPALWLNL